VSAIIARSLPSRWRVTLGLGLTLLAALLLLYRDTALSMVATWSRSDTYAHAFLVPPIVLWLIWRRRHVLARITPQPQPWVLLPMAAAGLLWLLGYLASVNAVMQVALVAMAVLLVPAVAGLAVTCELLFPLGFLFFAVPIGEFLTPFMIARTADATVAALRWSGIPVYREGMQFVIPSGQWSVVEACSGVRYLIASFMVGTLFAYLNYRSTHRRLLFVGVSILVPIVANWLRAYMIVMLGHLSDNRIATGVDHLVYGWVFFGIVILLMFVVGSRWAESDDPTSASAATVVEVAAPAPARTPMFVAALLAGVAMAVTWPQLVALTVEGAESERPPQLLLPDALTDGWQMSGESLADWAPGFLNPSLAVHRSYVRDGHSVGLYVGYYRQQGPDRKLVSSLNTLTGRSKDTRWNQVGNGSHTLTHNDGSTTVRSARLRGSDGGTPEHLMVWQLYWVNGRLTASDTRAKIETALSRLLGRGDDGAVLLFYAPYVEGDVDAAESTLQAFVGPQLEPLQALLRTTRDAR
jgi:exosortase A